MKRLSHNSFSLRFRRWSRRAWAVFASLGREVTIGTLRVQVTEKALEKTGRELMLMNEGKDLQPDEEEEIEEICLPEFECIAIRPALVPAGSDFNINCNTNKRLRRMYSFQPLLFL